MTDYAVLGIINLLLAISEDSATLRSDMSAVYGVWQESDVVSIALFFVAPSQSLSWKTEMRKTSGLGRAQCAAGAN